jgi:hypothetical protein
LSPKFRVKSSHNFTQLQQNVTAVCGIGCLASKDKFLVNNPLDAKENSTKEFTFIANSELANDYDIITNKGMTNTHSIRTLLRMEIETNTNNAWIREFLIGRSQRVRWGGGILRGN